MNSREHEHQVPATAPVFLSIIVPVHNEELTILHVLSRLVSVEYPCRFEIIVVDDGSTDGTADVLSTVSDPRVTSLRHLPNKGKGAAVRSGVSIARGAYVLVFDADLEYDPGDIAGLVEPIVHGRTSTVYGARLFGANTVYQSFWFATGNRVTTFVANLLYDAALSDLHTCLKLVPRELIESCDLTEDGFGLDTQMTARLLLSGVRPFEVPVSYHSRTRSEGKKIGWRHGVECLRLLVAERFAPRKPWLRGSTQVATDLRAATISDHLANPTANLQIRLPSDGPLGRLTVAQVTAINDQQARKARDYISRTGH